MRLPSGTTVALRASGLLGARYVQLIPGNGAGVIASGATIRSGETAISYGVPEALDTFDAQTRGGLRSTVRELGTGLAANGSRLNEAVRLSAGQMHRFQLMAGAVLDRPGAAARLLPGLEHMMRPLADGAEDLAALPAPLATAMAPFVDRRAAVRATLAQAPDTLAAARTALGEGRGLLAATRALATSARRTLPAAPAGLRGAAALLRESHAPLRRTTGLLRAAGDAIPSALRVTAALSPVLRPAQATFRDLVPVVARLGRYGCDLENFGVVFRSMTGLGGTGEGPIGPLMAFRLQSIPPSYGEVTGTKDDTGLVVREGYPAPCKYLSTVYAPETPRFGR